MKRIVIALIIVLSFSVSSHAADEVLNLFIWSEYIPDEVVAGFSKETGIKVNVSNYDSNEALYAKIKLAGQGYDIIVPSSDYVGLMRRQGLLLPVDKAKLTNFANLSSKFVNQSFDPDNTYSVPYMWGSTSITVNTDLVAEKDVQTLADLWSPALDGKLLLPNDMREVFALALIRLGYSVNDTDPKHIEEAYQLLKKLVPMVRVFDSDSPKQALLSGEVAVGMVWNGEAFIANTENPAIKYVYPPKGFNLWLDSLCIPKGAGNVAAAHKFLNYLLRPDVAATISTEMGYSTPNEKALDLVPALVRNNPIVYPPNEVMGRGEFQDYLGEAMKIYEKYWFALKSK